MVLEECSLKDLVNHLNGSIVLDIAIVASGREAIEVGTVGHVRGIPEVVIT